MEDSTAEKCTRVLRTPFSLALRKWETQVPNLNLIVILNFVRWLTCVAKHSPEYFRIGHLFGLRGTLNELVDGKVSNFQNGKGNDSEANKSRNINFDSASDDEFWEILSRNEFRDDPEKVVWNFSKICQEKSKIAFTLRNCSNDASRWIWHVKNI